MNNRIVYSKELFTRQIGKNKKRYRVAGVSSIVFIVVMEFFNILGFQIKDQIPTALGNLLATLTLIALCSWIFHGLYLLSRQQQAKESYISSNGYVLTYHVLKSRDTIGRIREVYHTCHITRIEKVIETTNHYVVYGDVELAETVNRRKHNKILSKVKIPKYFKELEEILNQILQNQEEDA